MQSIFDLTGRRILVTGASKGIGRALTEGLTDAGAHVVMNARQAEVLEAEAENLRSAGRSVSTAAFDVTDEGAVADAVARMEAEAPLDGLVNNAGIQHRAPLEDFPADRFEDLFRTNVRGVFLVAQAVARHMIPRGCGRILNVASVQSELARPTIAPYTATKGAVRNLTRGMATDWAKYGLQVNAIAPGYFKTPLNKALVEDPEFTAWLEKRTPAGRWGEVEELQGAAIFLLSDAASFINGQVLHIDGGITVTL